MTAKVMIRKHEYHDSVRLMQVSEQLRQLQGIEEAILMMATDNNKKLLDAADLLTAEAEAAARDDLVIGIIASSEEAADQALEKIDELLIRRSSGSVTIEHSSLASALRAIDANLALISIPGDYAAEETRKALEAGLNVMLFSDNVAIDEEVRLKQLASEKGLLLMGPDCGTAIINGCGLGFANVVERGNVGIVGASGTGIQELCVQLDRRGIGISHAIGTGGRDLKAEVGGLSMLTGLDLLTADPATALIILTSKPPDQEVAARVLDRAAGCGKPVIINFLGGDKDMLTGPDLVWADTLEAAAGKATLILTGEGDGGDALDTAGDDLQKIATEQARLLMNGQNCLRGLYSGGTLCYEAMLILQEKIEGIYSNIALEPTHKLDDLSASKGHTLLDLGDDMFTRGQAHPMIDPNLRNQRLVQEADDPDVAVILLDVVLGYGSHENPAGKLAESIKTARERAADNGRHLVFIANVCGTEQDPQRLSRQENLLSDAGVIVTSSNAQASRLAGYIINEIAKDKTM